MDVVISKHPWLVGAAAGTVVAASASVPLVAWPQAWSRTSVDPSLLALAWLAAAPLCGALATSSPRRFSYAPTAVLWVVACVLPWVFAVRLAAVGAFPTSAAEWGAMLLRATLVGTIWGMAGWWAVWKARPGEAADGGAVRASERTVLVVTPRADIAAELHPVLAERFGGVRVVSSDPEPHPRADLVIWDICLSSPEDLRHLAAIRTALPAARVMLVDRRGGAGLRVAPFRVPANPTRLSYDVEVFRARWHRPQAIR